MSGDDEDVEQLEFSLPSQSMNLDGHFGKLFDDILCSFNFIHTSLQILMCICSKLHPICS